MIRPGRRHVPTPSAAPGEAVAASFRDPSGFVFRDGGVVYRQVNAGYREHYDRLVASGLLAELQRRGLLVSHEELPVGQGNGPDAYKLLRPEPIPFVSYPYEWCFGQLRAAALVTLEIQEIALAHGMTLKDASAYNVQFRGSRPVFIDTLSFEVLAEGEPWVAYRQFCQHFLAPLALMRYVSSSLGRLLAVHLDGVPLDLASRLLPGRTKWSFSLLTHLHLHAAAQRKAASGSGNGKRPAGKISLNGLRGLVADLKSTIAGLQWKPAAGTWSDYYSTHAYSEETFAAKKARVSEHIARVRPSQVWDLGANEGVFSRLASDQGIATVAFDGDDDAIERCFEEGRARDDAKLLPLIMDLTNPSPGLGWAHRERDSLEARGSADLVLGLALVHHLCMGNNVPLELVARFFASVGRHVVVEWVPKSDPQVVRMLATRRDVFPGYHRDAFELAFGAHFRIEERHPLPGSERLLYSMARVQG